MKPKIVSHKIKEVETEQGKNIVLSMKYEYKGFTSEVSIIDLEEIPNEKVIKQYIKTVELAIWEEIKAKKENENKLKKEMKIKQQELSEMRKFVNSRTVSGESIESALKKFKESKNV